MKIVQTNITHYKALPLVLIFALAISCDPKKYEKIPLSDLDPKLKRKGELIVNDILESFNHEDGPRYLIKKGYITPLVHGRVMHNLEMYKQAYAMIPLTLGEVSKSTLFQVVDKRMVKTMRYKL